MNVSCCNNYLIKAEQIASYIPIVSTFVSLIDIFQKYVIIGSCLSKETIKSNRYYTYLQKKTLIDCLILLVPLVGNSILALRVYSKTKYDNKKFMMEFIKLDPQNLARASKRLKNDGDFIGEAIVIGGASLSDASEDLKGNKAYILSLFERGATSILKFVSDELKDDREVVMAAINANPWELEHASLTFRNDPEIVRIACRKIWRVAQFMGDQLKNNLTFVLNLLSINGLILAHVSRELQNHRDAAGLAIAQNKIAFRHIGPDLMHNKRFICPLLALDGLRLEHLAPDVQDDPEMVSIAVRSNPLAFQFASGRLKGDERMALIAIRADPEMILLIGEMLKTKRFLLEAIGVNVLCFTKPLYNKYRNDPRFLYRALSKNGLLLQYLGDSFKTNLTWVLIATAQNPAARAFASPRVQRELDNMVIANRRNPHRR